MEPQLFFSFSVYVLIQVLSLFRICLFGQQPHVDYAIDFVFLLFPVYLRLLIELAGSLSEQDRTARYADMQVIWDNLHQVLLDVDFNIQVHTN